MGRRSRLTETIQSDVTRESPNETVLVLLGAGRPLRGTQPSALASAGERGRVLDWLRDAFSSLALDRVLFVGGYGLDHVVSRYPEISFVVNTDWQSSGAVGSLMAVPLKAGCTAYVSYTDVVYERDLTTRLSEAIGDVVLVTDRAWRSRFDGRPLVDVRRAEKVCIEDDRVVRVSTDLTPAETSGEFIGLVKLAPRATTCLAELRRSSGRPWARRGLPDLLQRFVDDGLEVRAEVIDGRWAELNAPQDLARFILGTKAGTLARLRPMVRRSLIPDSRSFTVGDWREARSQILADIGSAFPDRQVIVRSSSLSEDSWATSSAGAFLSITSISTANRDETATAVDRVVASYPSESPIDEVLVQVVVSDVTAAGVLMTRSPETGAPYFVINYDDLSGRTDAVTSGRSGGLKMAYVHRSRVLGHGLGADIDRVLGAATELESLVGHDSLDIEFALLPDDRVAVLQVRPIVTDYGEWKTADEDVEAALSEAERELDRLSDPGPFVVGDTVCLGVMPDWNPAEILGVKPRRLALSLYQYLITDEVWAQQRAEFGYRDVRPCPLVVTLAGQPFVDVRASFNSFVPAALDAPAARGLVNRYVDRLHEHPELHDKVEFEIALTCKSLDFATRAGDLLAGALRPDQVDELGRALAELTRRGVEHREAHVAAVARLQGRADQIMADVDDPLDRAYLLLEDCRRIGTPAFSHLARDAFVAMEWLRSLVRLGVLDATEVEGFMGSLRTVTREFTDDVERLNQGQLTWDEFAARYGHLRPGTYELTSPRYADSLQQYLGAGVRTAPAAGWVVAHRRVAAGGPATGAVTAASLWPGRVQGEIERLLGAAGMPMSFDAFASFLRAAIEGREYAKFAFTRNLSAALEDLASVGAGYGLSRVELSHLHVQDLLGLRRGAGGRVAEWLGARAEGGERAYRHTLAVELPALVFRPEELRAFQQLEVLANFVTAETVRAPVAAIGTGPPDDAALEGSIALILSADPGYDWLFTRGIAGLITAYGGANSHMTIRAAERSLPAAIGVGLRRHDVLRQARVIELDCAARLVQVVM
jgi:choline kinase